MNATSTPLNDPREYEDLAWLVKPVASEPSSGRYLQIREFVMSEIQKDLLSEPHHRRRAPRRRVAYLASAAAAIVAIAAVAFVAGGFGGTKTPPATLYGQQILLAAATTAEELPDGAGTYWYLKVVSDGGGKPYAWETWHSRDGHTWFRGDKSAGTVLDLGQNPFILGGAAVSYEQIQGLPTDPAALKASIDQIVSQGDVRTSGGRLTATQQKRAVFEGLIALVSQLPAPQKVRAAAFRTIAGYPDVTGLGHVDGGLGLRITVADQPAAQLVIDPASAQVRRTNLFVSTDGALFLAAEGSAFTLTSEWTDTLPT